ncbi:hypothetical protein [Halarchaeum nitratireducens]|uniref:Uncharacterized protein n=1 Tax=Halarchaeum nitratireducens TaxID=489913 RepID=A0A830G7A4_9EURY|nr:hypothetical protein [Halarchaeum nitratireducens]GGN05711.1 hypothetical protein GCM10009021_00730 [Halarchaeum nitratireducens]
MVSERVRALVCAVVGLVVGAVLGPLFVPDPTGIAAGALAVVVALAVGGGLRATWGRDGA